MRILPIIQAGVSCLKPVTPAILVLKQKTESHHREGSDSEAHGHGQETALSATCQFNDHIAPMLIRQKGIKPTGYPGASDGKNRNGPTMFPAV